jgi:hypothetical protein
VVIVNNDNFDEIGKNVFETDELDNVDIKLNPDYYIHNALLKAQSCLVKDDFKAGMLQFRVIIEHIEGLCKSANRVANDYQDKLDAYKKLDIYAKAEVNIKPALLANKKLELLMENIFSMKTLTDPLQDSK